VGALRKEVAELEEKEKKLSVNLKAKKQGEATKARTSFKVDMEKA
jgi:hypothetical protein